MAVQEKTETNKVIPLKDNVESLGSEQICLVFALGQEDFGLDVNIVREIVRVPPFITRVPNAPHYIRGVVNLRGTIVPVFDMEMKLGMASSELSDEARIIVISLSDVTFGIIVNAVREVRTIYDSQIEKTNQEVSGSGGEKRFVGVAKPADGRLIVLLDVYTLFDLDQVLSESGVGE
jgi:purine-binding chemotaxis protein CheW